MKETEGRKQKEKNIEEKTREKQMGNKIEEKTVSNQELIFCLVNYLWSNSTDISFWGHAQTLETNCSTKESYIERYKI